MATPPIGDLCTLYFFIIFINLFIIAIMYYVFTCMPGGVTIGDSGLLLYPLMSVEHY